MARSQHALSPSAADAAEPGSKEEGQLDALLEISTTRRLGAQEVLFRKGAKGSELFVIMRGRLKIATAGDDGRELVLRIVNPGEVIGEIALLDGGHRTATITALEPVHLLAIRRHELLDLLRHKPEMALELLKLVATRLRHVDELIEDTTFRNLPARLARRLLALARAYGTRRPDGLQIDLGLSQQELGEMIATSRESVNRQMRIWTQAAVLTMNRGRITIRDELALGRLAR